MTRRTGSSGMIVPLAAGWIIALATLSVSAQALNFSPVGSIPGPVDMVRVQGEDAHVYVAAGRTLTVFDISGPAAPTRQGAYTFPEEIWSFRVAGASAYVGVNFFGLGILDVSNAAAPTLRGSFKTPGQAKTGAVSGTNVLVVDHMEGILLLDVSNPAAPVSLGSFFLDGYARDVVTAGSMAYAVDSPTGLYVFDLSSPDPLEPVGVIHSGTGLRSVEVADAEAAESANRVYLVGDGVLQVYDVSDPTAPIEVATYRPPGGAQRVSVRGTLAYVAAGQAGLQVVDLSMPSEPRLVGAYQTARPARDVAVADSFVYLVVGDRGGPGRVQILRQTPVSQR